MTQPPRGPERPDEAEIGYDREPRTGVPRWVKVAGIVAVVVALLVVAVMLVGEGGHRPRRHGPPEGTPPAVTGGGHTPPAGVHG